MRNQTVRLRQQRLYRFNFVRIRAVEPVLKFQALAPPSKKFQARAPIFGSDSSHPKLLGLRLRLHSPGSYGKTCVHVESLIGFLRSLTDVRILQAVEKRGVGAMELVAMDMKRRGSYIARQLSFYGVSFRIEEVPLGSSFVQMYNKAVKLVTYYSWICTCAHFSIFYCSHFAPAGLFFI